MTAGVITFVVSFFVPFAYWAIMGYLFDRTINVRAVEHTEERIEQQGLHTTPAVVVQLPTVGQEPALPKAA